MDIENLAVAQGRGSIVSHLMEIVTLGMIVTITSLSFYFLYAFCRRGKNYYYDDDRSSVISEQVGEDDEVFETILRRRINHNGEVPTYEYLVQWRPTWEPEETNSLLGGEGAWKLERILDRRHLDGHEPEILCQWADSWEPEDSISDEALLEAHERFRNNNDNDDDDAVVDDNFVDKENFDDDNDEGGDNSDDDDDESDDDEELYEFEGKIYPSYLEMVDAKRERNKRVVRRIVYGLLDDDKSGNPEVA